MGDKEALKAAVKKCFPNSTGCEAYLTSVHVRFPTPKEAYEASRAIPLSQASENSLVVTSRAYMRRVPQPNDRWVLWYMDIGVLTGVLGFLVSLYKYIYSQ